MVESNPLELKEFSEKPQEIVQTGYDVFDISMISLRLNDDGDRNLYTVTPDHLPSYELDVSNSNDVELEEDDYLMRYILRGLIGQSWRLIRTMAYGSAFPTVSSSADYYKVLYRWSVDFEYGLRRRPAQSVDESYSATSTLLDAIKGLNWYDDAVTGTDPNHWEWSRRFALLMGYYYSSRYPNIADRLDASTDTTKTRMTIILAAVAAIEFGYFLLMAAAQSDRAVMSLGALVEGILSKKVDRDAMLSSIDPIWKHLMIENKYDLLGSNLSSDGYDNVTQDIFDYSLLDSSNLDATIQKYQIQFEVPAFAVNGARRFFGIGKKVLEGTTGKETNHFAHLFNLVRSSSSGSWDTHCGSGGDATDYKWFAGLNIAYVIDVLEDLRSLPHDLREALSKRSHWTFKDLAQFADIFVNWDFTTSLNGFCDPDVYWGIRRHVLHDDQELLANLFHPMSDMNEADPNALDNSGVWYDGLTTARCTPWLSLLIPILQDERHRLVYYNALTLNEILGDITLGMLYDHKGADLANKWGWIRYRFVTMVNTRHPDDVYCIATPTTTTTVLRFEAIGDIFTATYDNIRYKYAATLQKPGDAFTRIYTAPRPKGFIGDPVYFEAYGRDRKSVV